MATRKTRPSGTATRKAIVTNPADPQSWLYLLTPVSEDGLVFGVLRRTYADRTNTASEFGRRKLQPVAPDGDDAAANWAVTAERVDVVLPAHAPDASADPHALLEAVDASAVAHQQALLAYATIPLGDVARLHIGWERCRAMARAIADTRQLATIIVLHAPGRVGSANPPHAHLLVAPRRIGPLGMDQGAYESSLSATADRRCSTRCGWRTGTGHDPSRRERMSKVSCVQ